MFSKLYPLSTHFKKETNVKVHLAYHLQLPERNLEELILEYQPFVTDLYLSWHSLSDPPQVIVIHQQ